MLRTIWQTYCFAEYVSPINNVCMSSRSSSTQLLHSLKVLVVELVVLNYFITSSINSIISRSSSTQLLHSLKVLVVEVVVLNYFIH